jgi:hypothetical protein
MLCPDKSALYNESCWRKHIRPFSFARPKENGQKEKDDEIELHYLKV